MSPLTNNSPEGSSITSPGRASTKAYFKVLSISSLERSGFIFSISWQMPF
jgi:hypothetical protein